MVASTREFYSSTADQVLEERVTNSISSARLDRQYIWDPAGYVDALVLQDQDTTGDGALDQRHYALTDERGSVIALADTTGTVTQRFSYDPYGKQTKLNADFTPDTTNSNANAATLAHGFQGLRQDASGLHFNRARYWHQDLGRFVSRDPAGYPDGLNSYAGYHVMHGGVDPSGMFLGRAGEFIGTAWESTTYSYGRAFGGSARTIGRTIEGTKHKLVDPLAGAAINGWLGASDFFLGTDLIDDQVLRGSRDDVLGIGRGVVDGIRELPSSMLKEFEKIKKEILEADFDALAQRLMVGGIELLASAFTAGTSRAVTRLKTRGVPSAAPNPGVGQGRRVIPDGQIDPAATILGNRFGGQASVRLKGFGNREFDFISERYVGQTFGGQNIANNAKNFLSKNRRTQIRETLRAASETGRQPLFNFEGVTPHADILDFINRNAQRAGVTPKITNIVPVPQ